MLKLEEKKYYNGVKFSVIVDGVKILAGFENGKFFAQTEKDSEPPEPVHGNLRSQLRRMVYRRMKHSRKRW